MVACRHQRKYMITEIKHTRNYHMAVTALEGYFGAFSICCIGGIATTSIISPILFLLCCTLIGYCRRLAKTKSARLGGTAAAVLFTVFYMLGDYNHLTGSLDSSLYKAGYLSMTAAGLFVLFYHCTQWLYHAVKAIVSHQSAEKPAGRLSTLRSVFSSVFHTIARHPALTLLLFLLLCWLPWFLYNYPGVMTPDSLSQYSQSMGLIPYSSHHSFIHTLLIQFWLRTGTFLFGSTYAGIACYTLFQMTIMAAAESCLILYLRRRGAGRLFCLLTAAFYGLVPYNAIYAVTMWKDVLFSASVLLFTTCLYDLLVPYRQGQSLWKHPGKLLALTVSGIFFCLLRSNGYYAFLLIIPFLLFAFRRQWKPVLTALLVLLAVTFFVRGPLLNRLQVNEPAFSESLSIPAQQIARVVYEGRSLTEEQADLLGRTVDISAIPQYYQPDLADPVKALIQYGHPEYLESHKKDYLKLWVELGLSYPLDYLNALIDQTKGYWFPAAPKLLTNEGISPNEVGLTARPVIHGLAAAKIVEIISKFYQIFPLLGILWSIGAFTWAVIFLFSNCLVQGIRRQWILFVPYFAIVLTLCIATPVASDLRYAYPLVLSLPLLLWVGTERGRASD